MMPYNIMSYLIVFLIILFVVILSNCLHESYTNTTRSDGKDPCKDFLTDNEFLEHMIPHHQVAIDMSKKLIKITDNPIMISFCHGIIWQQGYEIQMMEGVMNKLPSNRYDNIPKNKNKSSNYSDKTKLHFYNPKLSRATDYYCDPNFFNPNSHELHMKDMKLTNKSYLEHMIPHHQVAVDMSDRLLLHTKNIHMIDLAKTIIIEQQNEILKMNEMLNNMKSWNYTSDLLS